jgi:serine/threonine-protein kinase
MGWCWKARHLETGASTCIKFLHPERGAEPYFVRLFNDEARTLQALNHPNVLSIRQFGEFEGFYYIVTEYVEGTNLYDLIEAATLSRDELAEIIRCLGAAVSYIHRRGVLHRDIKPANVLIGADGSVKLADFGLSKILESPGDAASTGYLGTENYAAPEVLQGARYDHRADIFSLSITIYRLLTGTFPFTQANHRPDRPPISPNLEAILLRSMAPRPSSRHRSAQELCLDVLQELIGFETSPSSLDELRFSPNDERFAAVRDMPIPVGSGQSGSRPSRSELPTAAIPPRPTREPSRFPLLDSWAPIPSAR